MRQKVVTDAVHRLAGFRSTSAVFPLAFLAPRDIALGNQMKKHVLVCLALTMALTGSVRAQLGRLGSSGFAGATMKLFEANPTFSADIEIQTDASAKQSPTLPGKVYFDSGKSRIQINLSEARNAQGQSQFAPQMKAMGLDTTVTISRPDKKVSYVIYPSLNSFAETPLADPDAAKPASAFKAQMTEIGKTTMDGHPCVQNKVVVTDDQGISFESTVWSATDLKKFPVKVEMHERGHTVVMLFKNVKLAKPDAALFEPPTDFKKYDSQQAIVLEAMKKNMPAMAPPPAHP